MTCARRTDRTAWRAYAAWCSGLGRPPLVGDLELVAMYAVHAADRGLSLSSLRVALAAIQAAHRLAGIALDLRHPHLVMLLEGIARTKALRPAKQATAVGPEALRRVLATRPGPETPLSARDRTLLLLDFRHTGSEHTGGASGAALPIFVGLSNAGRLSSMALSDKVVWSLITQAARDAGLANLEGYSCHSLPIGLAIAACEAPWRASAMTCRARHMTTVLGFKPYWAATAQVDACAA